MRPWFALLCALLFGANLPTGAAALDCLEALEITHAERTVLRDGDILHRSTVDVQYALTTAWRRETARIRYRMRLDGCPQAANWGLWIYRIGDPFRA